MPAGLLTRRKKSHGLATAIVLAMTDAGVAAAGAAPPVPASARACPTPVGCGDRSNGGGKHAHGSPLPADPVDLATDGARIYWTNALGAVCAAPIEGAPAAADAGPSGCGASIVVAARDGGPAAAQLAVNATSVFLTYNAHVYAAPTATGALVQIANLPGYSVGGLTEEGGHLFWAAWNTDAGGIASAEDDGGGAKLVVASALDGKGLQAAFAVDADGLYWGARTYTKLWASARDGSAVRLLACDASGAAAVATDAANVYWLTNDGAVKRVAKR